MSRPSLSISPASRGTNFERPSPRVIAPVLRLEPGKRAYCIQRVHNLKFCTIYNDHTSILTTDQPTYPQTCSICTIVVTQISTNEMTTVERMRSTNEGNTEVNQSCSTIQGYQTSRIQIVLDMVPVARNALVEE